MLFPTSRGSRACVPMVCMHWAHFDRRHSPPAGTERQDRQLPSIPGSASRMPAEPRPALWDGSLSHGRPLLRLQRREVCPRALYPQGTRLTSLFPKADRARTVTPAQSAREDPLSVPAFDAGINPGPRSSTRQGRSSSFRAVRHTFRSLHPTTLDTRVVGRLQRCAPS
jgi:hypothetical protein